MTNDFIVYLIYRFIQERLRDLYFKYVMHGTILLQVSQCDRMDRDVLRDGTTYLFDLSRMNVALLPMVGDFIYDICSTVVGDGV